jgi:hypothetical protein
VGGKRREDPDVRGGRGFRGECWRGRGEVGGRFAKMSPMAALRCTVREVVSVTESEGGGIGRIESEGEVARGTDEDEDGAVGGEQRGL